MRAHLNPWDHCKLRQLNGCPQERLVLQTQLLAGLAPWGCGTLLFAAEPLSSLNCPGAAESFIWNRVCPGDSKEDRLLSCSPLFERRLGLGGQPLTFSTEPLLR